MRGLFDPFHEKSIDYARARLTELEEINDTAGESSVLVIKQSNDNERLFIKRKSWADLLKSGNNNAQI